MYIHRHTSVLFLGVRGSGGEDGSGYPKEKCKRLRVNLCINAGVGGCASGGDAPHNFASIEPASASGGDAQHNSASIEPASASGHDGGTITIEATDEEMAEVARVLATRLRNLEETAAQEGMRQKELIQWYVEQYNQEFGYNSMDEAREDIKFVRALIQNLIDYEMLIVVNDGRQPVSKDDRILDLAPQFKNR